MYYNRENILGTPQTLVTATTADWQSFLGRDSGSAGTVPLPYPGTVTEALDPTFGSALFMLAYGVAGLQIGEAVMIGAGFAATRTVAATRGQVAVSMAANTDPTALSWFCIRGQVPMRALVAAANVNMYTSATAGSPTNTVVATQGITGLTSLTALAAAITTKSVATVNGSAVISVPDMNGLYVGGAISGTGIPGGATISSLGVGGLMLGSANAGSNVITISANCTATGQVTGTFSHGAAFCLANVQHPVAANLG
jgi:hypothetical protein